MTWNKCVWLAWNVYMLDYSLCVCMNCDWMEESLYIIYHVFNAGPMGGQLKRIGM